MPAKAKYPVCSSFHCSHELSDKLDLMVKREGVTMGEFIRSALTVYIGLIEEKAVWEKNKAILTDKIILVKERRK